jgi:hypothetical protein
MLKWLAVWLLLAAVYLLVHLICRRAGGGALLTRDDLSYLLLVPLVQAVALAALAFTQPRRGA